MADICDLAQEVIEQQLQRDLHNAGVGSYELPPGKPGDCEYCGEWSGRLVEGACAPCREHYRLDKAVQH